MSRTTLNIDDPILNDLKRLQEKCGKSLGRLVSDLLAEAIVRSEKVETPPPFVWVRSPGRPLVDPLDKDAIYAILDDNEKSNGDG